jgi:hypothetical protein
MVNADAFKIIQTELEATEQNHNVQILHAAESGSRAWGFPSPDSDYDIRFIYVRQITEYLKVNEGKDTIEKMSGGKMFDYSGWDLKKTLHLLKKSNPTLLDWFQSQIEYQVIPEFKQDIWDLIDVYFNPKTSYFHYVSMAKNNRRHYIDSEKVKIKKYLYVLRAIFAAQWSLHRQTVVPIDVFNLIDNMAPMALGKEVKDLIDRKVNEPETKEIEQVGHWNLFIDTFLEDAFKVEDDRWLKRPGGSKDPEPANNVFRKWAGFTNSLINPDSWFECIFCKTRFPIAAGHRCGEENDLDQLMKYIDVSKKAVGPDFQVTGRPLYDMIGDLRESVGLDRIEVERV